MVEGTTNEMFITRGMLSGIEGVEEVVVVGGGESNATEAVCIR